MPSQFDLTRFSNPGIPDPFIFEIGKAGHI